MTPIKHLRTQLHTSIRRHVRIWRQIDRRLAALEGQPPERLEELVLDVQELFGEEHWYSVQEARDRLATGA